MSDNVESRLLTTALSEDTAYSKLQRESELLRDGLVSGVVDRLSYMTDHVKETVVDLSICGALGAGLNLAGRAGGKWATGARVATWGFGLMMTGDVIRRGIPTLNAMADTWSSAERLESNKETVGKYAGSALVDYPLMCLAGYGGLRLAGKVPMTFTIEASQLKPVETVSGNVIRLIDRSGSMESPAGPREFRLPRERRYIGDHEVMGEEHNVFSHQGEIPWWERSWAVDENCSDVSGLFSEIPGNGFTTKPTPLEALRPELRFNDPAPKLEIRLSFRPTRFVPAIIPVDLTRRN